MSGRPAEFRTQGDSRYLELRIEDERLLAWGVILAVGMTITGAVALVFLFNLMIAPALAASAFLLTLIAVVFLVSRASKRKIRVYVDELQFWDRNQMTKAYSFQSLVGSSAEFKRFRGLRWKLDFGDESAEFYSGAATWDWMAALNVLAPDAWPKNIDRRGVGETAQRRPVIFLACCVLSYLSAWIISGPGSMLLLALGNVLLACFIMSVGKIIYRRMNKGVQAGTFSDLLVMWPIMDAEVRTFRMVESKELSAMWQKGRWWIWVGRIVAISVLVIGLVASYRSFNAAALQKSMGLIYIHTLLIATLSFPFQALEKVWSRVRDLRRMVGSLIKVRNRQIFLEHQGEEYEVVVQEVGFWRSVSERGPGGTSLRTLVSGGKEFVIAADLMVEVTEAEDEAEAESVEMNPADSLNNPDLEAESNLQVEG